MVTGESLFRYFRQPHAFSIYVEEAKTCDGCGVLKAGYGGPFYGRGGVQFVCEECLAAGRLAELQAFTCEGDIKALREQLRELHPELDDNGIKSLVQERITELEYGTPHIVTWQGFRWPAHCGDFCCLMKEAGKPDLNELEPDGDGRAFFGAHLYGRLRERTPVDDVWQSIRADSPKDNSIAYHVGVYLFRCLHCGEHVILWDAN